MTSALDQQLELPIPDGGIRTPVRYVHDGRSFLRIVTRREGGISKSHVSNWVRSSDGDLDEFDAFDLSWLRSPSRLDCEGSSGTLRIVDLFSGCGGLSLGAGEACRALGITPSFSLACDLDTASLDVYQRNFAAQRVIDSPIQDHVNGAVGRARTAEERRLERLVGDVDLVLAGPPCQGHSDLNNHTRRDDPKNELVVRVARFVELFRPRTVVIENVPGIRHDRKGALNQARRFLLKLGYSIEEGLLSAAKFGVAQSRRRYFLVASLDAARSFSELTGYSPTNERPIAWAIGDLLGIDGDGTFDTAAQHSEENRRRIRYLFDNELYELPDSERPNCHKSGGHRYQAVYGRMTWTSPSPTITTGFGSTGQGRFVHPLEPRTLTPHEAARVQFFPDFFDFGSQGRRSLQQLIGNAVPSKLAFCILLNQLR